MSLCDAGYAVLVGDELAGKLSGGIRQIARGRGHVCELHHTSYVECTIRSVVIIRGLSAVEKCTHIILCEI